MSDAVLVSIVTVVVGGIFTIIFKFIDAKANKTKDEISKNASEVEMANKILEGMQILANNLRTEYDREHDRAERLQKELIEEKAINLALFKQKEKDNDRTHRPRRE